MKIRIKKACKVTKKVSKTVRKIETASVVRRGEYR